MLIVLTIIFFIYFIEINKDYYLNEEKRIKNKDDLIFYKDHQYWITIDHPFHVRMFKVDQNQFNILDKLITILYYIVCILLVIGIIAYGGEIKMNIANSKDKKFTWFKVLTETSICDLKDKKNILYYFKKGLGIKI
jgi:hypothetical protein